MDTVSDWDPLSDLSVADPVAADAEMRNRCPVAYSDAWGGFWALFKFDDVKQAARDHETFTASQRIIVPEPGRGPWLPLQSDPPAHKGYRDVVAPLFRASRLASFEPVLRTMTNELIDAFANDTEVDVIDKLARPLPALAIALLLGLPSSDWELLRRWSDTQIEAMGSGDLAAIDAIQQEMVDYFDKQLEQRRNAPSDDVISSMMAAQIDGRQLTVDELRGIFLLLIVAGHETTTNAIGSILIHLAQHPAKRRMLIEDPDAMNNAIEEFVRFVAPVRAGARTTSREVEIGGRTLPEGARVVLMFSSGSRDDEHFERADECQLHRRGAGKHLAFGTGVHRCLGEHLARLELRVVTREFLRRFADFEVVGSPIPSMWPVQGYSSAIMRLGT
ncbi:hypothetical protein A5742_04890 [Mycolicibacterium fortuitum]|uniref:Steroid C26-monooxygenase n=2 Tax=Mycolicibacterium fortuitum TaxID=1766 RepID=A0ABD6QIY7_MYCFO|nr:hypothetical protein A5742_04890 [Mycolicibacterium fortuitum]